ERLVFSCSKAAAHEPPNWRFPALVVLCECVFCQLCESITGFCSSVETDEQQVNSPEREFGACGGRAPRGSGESRATGRVQNRRSKSGIEPPHEASRDVLPNIFSALTAPLFPRLL